MPTYDFRNQDERNNWLKHNWDSPARQQQKDLQAPVLVDPAFEALHEEQAWKEGKGLGSEVEVAWDGLRLVIVSMRD